MKVRKFLELFQYIPLSTFVLTHRLTGSWDRAFQIGGLVALAQTTYFLYSQLHINRFLAAVNLFILGGAIGLGFQIGWLENAYEALKQTTLFISLLVVGIVTTLFSSQGFIDVSRGQRRKIIQDSLLLVAATMAACFWSWYWRDLFFVSVAPFILLIFLQKILAAHVEQK